MTHRGATPDGIARRAPPARARHDYTDPMSAPGLSDRFRRHADVVTRDILGETLLVPVSSQVADMEHIFALNDTGAFVWQRLDGETPLAAILDGLVEAFDVEPAPAWDDLRGLVAELDAAGLVRPAE